jgi:hypothetical protein
VKLSYNALPEVSYWWADGYADFDGAQSLRLKQDLASLQAWHRQRELPRYRELLLTLARWTAEEPEAAELCSLVPLAPGCAQAWPSRARP